MKPTAEPRAQSVPLPGSSLIICSRNRPMLLRDTVDSVLRGSAVPAEIIVIDQSDDPNEPLAALKTPGTVIRYKHTRSRGLSRARNAGIHLAEYDALCFTDDDMLVDPKWYSTLLSMLAAAGQRSAVTGAVHSGGSGEGSGFVPSLVTDTEPAVYEGRTARDVLYTGNMAIWRSAIDAVGLFDERLGAGSRFPGAEDNDFGYRLLQAGFRILYVPDAVVYHRAWRATSAYVPLRWAYGLGQGGFYGKYAMLRDRQLCGRAAGHFARVLLRAPARVLRSPRRGMGDLVYALGIVVGLANWLIAESRRS